MRDRSVLFLAIAQMLIWAATFYSFPAMLLRWEEAFGWGRGEITAAITLAVMISAATSLIACRLIDRGNGAIMMALSALLGGIAIGLLSLVNELWQFYALWAFIGAMNGCCLYEPCFALVTRARGVDAKRGIILITLIAGFAGTLSFPLAHTMSDLFGWQSAVITYSVIASCIAAPLMYLGASEIENNPTSVFKHETKRKPSIAVYRNNRFWFLGIGFSFGAILHGVTLHHLLPIMQDRGASGDTAVLAASFIGPMPGLFNADYLRIGLRIPNV